MSRAFRVQVMYHLCVMIAVFGVYWEFGIGWAAMIGGVVEAVSFLALVDVDDKREEGK